MGDSDSDDELMSRLTSSLGGFGRLSGGSAEDCSYCGTPNAALACSICQEAFYCTETCKIRHAKAHRAFCITARMQKEESESSEEESSEEESDSDSELGSQAPVAPTSSRRSGGGGGPAALQIPGLTQQQIKQLLDLSAKAETMSAHKDIDKLQKQIAQLMEDKSRSAEAKRDRAASNSPPVNLREIRELQKKLQDLEKKTQNMPLAPQGGAARFMPAGTKIYTPTLVKDDPAFRKYFKLLDMSMPVDQIRAKMEAEGVSPALLETPDAVSPNDPGPKEGDYVPMTVANDPALKKYFKLKAMSMPEDQIKLKMEADGVDPSLLDTPSKISPNDPGPPAPASMGFSMGRAGFSLADLPPLSFPSAVAPMSLAPPYIPLLVKDDPQFKKYFKLLGMGMPVEQVKLKMKAEEADPDLLDRPESVSPNDAGPPPSPTQTNSIAPGSPVSMEQLFSILMQHQQIIQQVSSGGLPGRRASRDSVGGVGDRLGEPRSVEDQMARELAAADSAIDDIFGDDSQKPKGIGGMSMIEQLEKKARKESNKKLVERREEVNRLINELLSRSLSTDAEAMAFYNEIAPKLEDVGLSLGTDAVQTWSSRLLIKNKDTRDWYFSEEERLNAGKAYGRLWALSFLERDAGQLLAKRAQIENAPATLRATSKGKPELIDKFTQLLKEAVKLKHKVFKNNLFTAELQRVREFGIPERFDALGGEMMDASAVLASAAMGLAEDEFRAVAVTTRAKKIRALTAVHVAEKAVQLVGIVKKLGASGVDGERLRTVEAELARLKDAFVTGQQEEEEEDDVL